MLFLFILFCLSNWKTTLQKVSISTMYWYFLNFDKKNSWRQCYFFIMKWLNTARGKPIFHIMDNKNQCLRRPWNNNIIEKYFILSWASISSSSPTVTSPLLDIGLFHRTSLRSLNFNNLLSLFLCSLSKILWSPKPSNFCPKIFFKRYFQHTKILIEDL